MRYAIFSDVHANLEAFQAVLSAYQKENIDYYFCLGDIVGYGTDYSECIRLIKELKAVSIAGNHEWGVCGKLPLESFTPLAKEAVVWTSKRLNPGELVFLGSLPLVYSLEDFVLVHSSLETPEEFYYLNNYDEAYNTFNLLKKSACFIGHTHKPGIFVEENSLLSFRKAGTLQFEENKRYIINVGSVGQSRDGDWRASFAVYDSSSKIVEIKRIGYDVETAQKKILASGLSEELALRLSQNVY